MNRAPMRHAYSALGATVLFPEPLAKSRTAAPDAGKCTGATSPHPARL